MCIKWRGRLLFGQIVMKWDINLSCTLDLSCQFTVLLGWGRCIPTVEANKYMKSFNYFFSFLVCEGYWYYTSILNSKFNLFHNSFCFILIICRIYLALHFEKAASKNLCYLAWDNVGCNSFSRGNFAPYRCWSLSHLNPY